MANWLDTIKTSFLSHPLPSDIPNNTDFVQLSFTTEKIDILSLLSRTQAPHFYWKSRDFDLAVGCIGAAFVAEKTVPSVSEPMNRLLDLSVLASHPVRFYGGCAFPQTDPLSDEWKPFGSGQFFLPQLELRQEHEACRWIMYLSKSVLSSNVATYITQIFSSFSHSQKAVNLTHITKKFSPNFKAWQNLIPDVLKDMSDLSIEKIVVARRLEIGYQGDFNPIVALAKLSKSPGFHFLFSPTGKSTFWGVSPELLLSCFAGNCDTEAVAGTGPRGKTPEEDAQIATSLMDNDKMRFEHDVVKKWVVASVKSVAENIDADYDVSILKLPYVQHLMYKVRTVLAGKKAYLPLLEKLFPTPAVCGTPLNKSLDLIQQKATFSRGLYAGFIGWFDVSDCQFTVGIRSALTTESSSYIFAGAGIVDGSKALVEWQEIEDKTMFLLEQFESDLS